MWFKQGQIEVDGGDECDCESVGDGDECGAGNAKKKNITSYLLPTKLPPLHPIPNQSKPIVSLLSSSLL